MTTAWVLMTAMPPTKGHLNLIKFAAYLQEVDNVKVIVCTQPDEPYAGARWGSISEAASRISLVQDYIHVEMLHRELEQNPAVEGFWPMWDNIMLGYGAKPGDYYVTSEPYGATLAERLGGVFVPYDPARELYYTKATNIRGNLIDYFADILPEFQHNLRTTVTVFGAESTGKTTLSKELAADLNGHWLFEYARPYLELVGPEINVKSMEAIWRGQYATQRHALQMYDKPFVIQDTDLFSTVGYWAQPHWEADLGPVPQKLVNDAIRTKSDLYIITKSNIPFEEDPIRYGGDRRESDDNYWIALAEKYKLNYIVLESSMRDRRLHYASTACKLAAWKKAQSIAYDRGGF